MKFQISKPNLIKALETVLPIASKKTSLPILNNAKCVIRGNRIRFHAFDTENAIRCYADLENADSEGQFLIDPAEILKYAKNISADIVDVCVENSTFTISHNKSCAVFPSSDADQYPDTWDDEQSSAVLKLPKDFVGSMVADGKAFVGTDDFHPQLQCVYIYSQEGRIGYAATDSRKLVCNSIPAPDVQPSSVLIHQSVLPLLPDSECDIHVKEKHTIFDFGSVKICAALPQGRYPDFRRIIPPSAAASVEIPLSEFRIVVRRLLAMASSSMPCATFKFGMFGIDISTRDIDRSKSASEFVDCPSTSEFSIALSLQFLADTIGRLSSDKFTIGYVDVSRPVLFTEQSNPDRVSILMPMTNQQ